MITTLLAIAQTALIYILGYMTAKLIRRIKDELFLDELRHRLIEKIAETELAKRDVLENVIINNEDNN